MKNFINLSLICAFALLYSCNSEPTVQETNIETDTTPSEVVEQEVVPDIPESVPAPTEAELENISELSKNIQGSWSTLIKGVSGMDTLEIEFRIVVNGNQIVTSSEDNVNGRMEVSELFETSGDTLLRYTEQGGQKYYSEEYILIEDVQNDQMKIEIIASDASSKLTLFKD